MDKDPVFEVGQVVEATCSYGFLLTEGKQYTVVEIIPKFATSTYTFPEYVVVIGDHGKRCAGHTYRFKPV